MKTSTRIVLVVVVVGLLAACNIATPSGGGDSVDGGAPIVVSNYAAQADGSYLFETNNKADKGSIGQTFYGYDSTKSEQGSFDFTFELIKDNGAANGGYGVIFQRTDKDHYWCFEIDVNGYYFLGKKVGTTMYTIFSWKAGGTHVLKGYGTKNSFTIHFDGSSGYDIYANGESSAMDSFSDNDNNFGATLRSGCFGLSAEVMTNEIFPDTPVRVRSKILSPSGIAITPLPSASRTLNSRGAR